MSEILDKTGSLSAEEKRRLLARLLKERRAKEQADRPLHRTFEAQAARTPDAIALTCEGRHLSYRELNARANRLAHRLRSLGVGPESLVGLCADRSIGMVVGLLAILKAGGAYVPLDPVYPPDRLGFQLADSGAKVLLAERAQAALLPPHAALVVDIDEAGGGNGATAEDLDSGATASNLAYVIYTSGSTGRPKGVPVTHANVARLFTATHRWFGFDEKDVWTLFHSFAFDFSVWEIWGALLYGGRLVIVPYWVSRSPESFRELLRAEGVTVLNQTPSAFRQLVRADEAAGGAPLALRRVIFGGEALELQSLRPWFDRHGDETPQLVNMYGITETTVHVTYRPIARADLEACAGSSPIGRPIPDLRLYLLGRGMQPVPPGVAGEIYVGGEGVARGYLGRAGLTAERFVPDPFSDRPGARLYRSGDLARYRADGELEYLGRADRQVKIRGFRIELGEIEAALARQPELHEAVVVARPDRRGDARLVAYVVPRAIPGPSGASLRKRLKESLPDYMVPAVFVPLEALPLTPNGKVDDDALPSPDAGRSEAYVAPRTPTEEAIAETWAGVLGIDRVGARDDFFALGGHSLLAAQAVSRLREALGADVPLRALFEAPTVAGLAERIEEGRLSGRYRVSAPIAPGPREGDLPLSFAQQALWFLDRMAPGEPTFNVTAAVRIGGPLDAAALGRSFREIVRRHEALRTTFPAADGRPVQAIAPSPDLPLATVDLTGLPEADREEEARVLAAEEARRPFDLARGPLVRARLLKIDERDHVLLLTLHHIITDGWSMGVAAAELAALYEAYTAGLPSPLPPLAIQYADYAAWQRDRLRGEVLDDLVAYWSGRLAGLAPLALPTDRPRPAVRSSRGDVRFFSLPAELAEGLQAVGRGEGATLFMTLLAAFQALLGRYSGSDDVAVGVPVANRNRPEVEGLIGYFVNMLVLRTDLSGDPSFRALLGRVREVALGAFEHQELPFDKLVERLQPARDPSRTPLFDVMFVLQNNRMPDASRQDLSLGGLEVSEGSGTAKFDLTLGLEEWDEGLGGSLEYNTDLFDAATIDRMIGHFRALLEGVVADPDRALSAVPLLGEPERALVVDAWNDTANDVPADRCLHELIEAQAVRTPDAAALAFRGREWTYADLNARADRLARDLRSRGVGPEARVGLCVDRSAEMAVGLLGILKAGAAFLPLDPAEPRARLAAMLDDASVALVVTRDAVRSCLDGLPVEALAVDAEAPMADDRWPMTDDQGTLSPPSAIGHESSGHRSSVIDCRPSAIGHEEVTPANAAYVIYTSGSTGTPRGVVIEHRSVVNHAVAASRLFGLGPGDRVLQFAPLSFDIAVEEIFPAWTSGATVVLREDDRLLDPEYFTGWIARERITVLDLPTAYWHAWVDRLADLGRSPEGPLRLVVVGGEKASAASHAAWRRIAGDRVRWINTYGPTEATVIATADEPADDGDAELPIGRPIANARVYVLDRNLRPAPIGVPGELYIGGAGVGRGYLGLPGASAERFVPDPFSTLPGARLFRTGDLARWRADGRLAFLGRVDHQAKIRGFRVEPGEVEAALRAHPGVRIAAVVARPGGEGDGRLDAYYVPRDGGTVAADDLLGFLRERLPRHMIPATFTPLDALPLTSSGKVDRRALPAPGRVELAHEGAAEAPRDEVESRLAAIWEEVLDVRPIGVTDGFFDLGGHSLLAIRMQARVEAEFGRPLPLASLFLGATIAELAGLLRGPIAARAASPLVTIQPRGAGRPFFCVHPVGGIVHCFLDLARRLGTDRPFHAFEAAGLAEGTAPIGRLDAMAAHYLAALRRAQPEGPYHLGGWSLGGLVAFEMARQLRDQGQEVATLAVIDAHAPTGPDPGPFLALAREAADLALFRELDTPPSVDDVAILLGLLGDIGGRGRLRRLVEHLRALEPHEQRLHALKSFNLDAVHRDDAVPGRLERLWNVLCASLLAAARYTPGPYPGRLLLLRAAETRGTDADLGWRALAAGVTTRAIPGNHDSILHPPGVDVLADVLRAEIEKGERNIA